MPVDPASIWGPAPPCPTCEATAARLAVAEAKQCGMERIALRYIERLHTAEANLREIRAEWESAIERARCAEGLCQKAHSALAEVQARVERLQEIANSAVLNYDTGFCAGRKDALDEADSKIRVHQPSIDSARAVGRREGIEAAVEALESIPCPECAEGSTFHGGYASAAADCPYCEGTGEHPRARAALALYCAALGTAEDGASSAREASAVPQDQGATPAPTEAQP